MSYVVHNFQNGEVIEAGPVNEMDAQILLNSNTIDDKQDAPATAGTAGQVLGLDSNLSPIWVDQQGAVDDVQIDGTSILSQGVANIPKASSSALGTVKVNGNNGIYLLNDVLTPNTPSDAEYKAGSNSVKPIVPNKQHFATFYGLAKVAGVDLASATVTVGTYPANAKAAIQTMIGVEQGVVFVEEVTGTTPTITGVANTRYVCGEVAELTITPPASGTIDVRFTSGTTPTVLTIPSTVKFPDWVDLTTIEASTTYEIMITDGVYGGVMTWPV